VQVGVVELREALLGTAELDDADQPDRQQQGADHDGQPAQFPGDRQVAEGESAAVAACARALDHSQAPSSRRADNG
jgi:hypothetical protein